MVDKEKLYERLMATCLDELDQHVRAINSDSLEIEKQPENAEREQIMPRLFRSAHSLKRASRAVNLSAIEMVCHELEEVFRGMQQGTVQSSQHLFSTMFSAADAIEAAGMQLREKAPIDEERLESVLPELKVAASGEAVATQTDSPIPQSELPVEISTATVSPPIDDKPLQPVVDSADSKQPESSSKLTTTTAEPKEKSPRTTRKKKGSVRVAEEKLDSLMAQAGELLVARQRVDGRPEDVEDLTELVAAWKTEWQAIEGTLRNLVSNEGGDRLMRRSARLTEQIATVVERNGENLRGLEKQLDLLKRNLVNDARQLRIAGISLHEDVHRIRMLPFSEACEGLDRVVRDLAASSGKQVELSIEGGEIDMDRAVLDGLKNPLMHLVQNAVDHGIETPDERQSAGKHVPARITITAALRGAQVDVIVADDGRGLNLERIREKLSDLGIPESADESELTRAIFLPGFSTASIVTDVSGRGVGMDVVKTDVEALHGSVDISSATGFGTRFVLTVPLTLTTISALFVQSGGQRFAVPSRNVTKLVRFSPDQIRSVQGRDVLPLGDYPIPVSSLSSVLGHEESRAERISDKLVGVILTNGEHEIVFTVDAVDNEQEAVIKNLGPRIHPVRFASGAIMLPTGGIALLLNAANLIRSGIQGTTRFESVSTQMLAQTEDKKRLLVVDDSITTRTLLKSILEAADYDVTAAVDGRDAWRKLQSEEFELVVTDVDMPNLDGFELTHMIRDSGDMKRLPVILVTSRDSEEDKTRGVQSGANAYLVKSAFDQTRILETIEQFL